MAFAVATCPKCSEHFRLIWRIGKRKLPVSTVIRLTCPACGHVFEQAAVELTVFDAGREEFPKSVVVEVHARAAGGCRQRAAVVPPWETHAGKEKRLDIESEVSYKM